MRTTFPSIGVKQTKINKNLVTFGGLDTFKTRKIETELYENGTSDFVPFAFTQKVKTL